MRKSAVRRLKHFLCFNRVNNKNILVTLTVEKLSGFGVLCCEYAARVLNKVVQGSGCIFIANKLQTTISL